MGFAILREITGEAEFREDDNFRTRSGRSTDEFGNFSAVGAEENCSESRLANRYWGSVSGG